MKAGSVPLLLCLLAAGGCSKRSSEPAPRAASSDYINSRVCTGCHVEIAKSYRQTGMGRSFYRATPANLNVEAFSKTFYHKPSDRHYEMVRRGDRFFMTRHQTGYGGQKTNVIEKEIHYVLGSGNHARSYLSRTPENRLVELPVGWYAENGGTWAMSPGYDRADHQDFRRQVGYSCMSCHNGYPQVAPGQDVSGADAIYPSELPEGIDCQRCHGPGKQHVEAAQSSQAKDKIRAAIVNPARLTPERQLEVCMQCHLETTTFPLPNAIQRFDRGTFSYRAGEPLANYILHFDHAKGSGKEDKFEIAGSAYRLRQSACFLESKGALRCTTCHDPHKIIRGDAAVQHYKAVCQSCHKDAHSPSPDCASCHMPKRRTEDVVHVVMTDHKIQRRPPARALAERSERHDIEGVSYQGEVSLYYPKDLPPSPERDLYLALAQVAQKSNLKTGIAQLEAAIAKHKPASPEFYFELGQAYEKSGRRSEAIGTYQRAVEHDAKFLPALRSLGAALLQSGEPTRAVEMLERARASSPKDAVTRNELAKAYSQVGRLPEAIAEAQEAVRLDPDLTVAHYMRGNLTQSEQAYREAIRIQPDFAEAHNDLANLPAARKDFNQADYHFEIATELSPKEAAIRYNYGVSLALREQFDRAQREFERAVTLAPAMAEAHVSLGDLRGRAGDWRGASRHYENALKTRPDFGPALLGMGMARGAMGDFGAARSFLNRAAASSVPGVREEATDLLRSF